MKLLTTIIVSLLCLNVIGQQNRQQFTTQNGLSSNMIYTLFESRKGDIWIGTAEGIDIFTGVFENRLDKTVHQGFFARTGSDAFSFFQTQTGDMWLRYSRNNITELRFLDGVKWVEPDGFKKLSGNLRLKNTQPFIAEARERLWVSTSAGIVEYDGLKWKLHDSDYWIDWVVSTSDGQLWTYLWKVGIASFDGKDWRPRLDISDTWFGESNHNIAFVTSKGMILVGTDSGIFQYDPILNIATDLKLGEIDVYIIAESLDGSIWVGSDNGLYHNNGIRWKQHTFGGKLETPITDISTTTNGTIWVSGKKGLYKYTEGLWSQVIGMPINCVITLDSGHTLAGGPTGLFAIVKEEATIGNNIFLKGELVERMVEAPDGIIWFQSTRGISSYNGVSWTHYEHNIPKKPNRAMVADLKGNVWFARGGGNEYASNLLRYDGKELKSVNDKNATGPISNIVVDHSDSIWVVGNRIPSVYDGQNWTRRAEGYPKGDFRQWGAIGEDAEGKMWVGGGGADGVLYYFDRTQWQKSMSFSELGSTNLWSGFESIFQTRNGDFFAGSMQGKSGGGGGGIFRYSEDKKWNKESESQLVQSFHETMDGDLVAVDDQNGLLKRTNDGSWRPVLPENIGEVKYSDVLGAGFVEQPKNVYWLATNNGLLRIEGDLWYFISVSDGLPSNNVLTVSKDSKGRVWVGTEFGATYFSPQIHQHPPAVKLTKIDGKNYESEIQREGNKFTYETGRTVISIEWSGGDLQTSPQKIRYQYKLTESKTGSDSWSPLIRETSVNLGVSTGLYKFFIRAIDHHFNTSPVDSITIIVKSEAPYLSIGKPVNGEIISGEFYIKGRIKDDDFSAFQVFISDSTTLQEPIFEDDTEKVISPHQLIYQASQRPRTNTLARLDTRSVDDGNYQIWLTAQDKLGHTSFDQVVFRVDNTPPLVEVLTPKSDEQILKDIFISATVSDIHLDNYRIDYSTNLTTNEWLQIYVKSNLYQTAESSLEKPSEWKKTDVQQRWEIPVAKGSVRIRLMATDIAGNTNSQIVQVELPPAVEAKKGGTIFLSERRAELYFPPNTLAQDTIVTINALTPPDIPVEPSLSRLTPVYNFAPASLELDPIKPATLTLPYDPAQLSVDKQPIIFHRTDGSWKVVGGTFDPRKQTISAAVLSLGQYTIVETDQVQSSGSASLLSGSLTCQPRVFSPRGNSFSNYTTISFALDQPANASIKIYSAGGQLVNWLAEEKTFGQGKQAFNWDGRDNSGEIVATGLYIVTVTVNTQMQSKVVNVWNH